MNARRFVSLVAALSALLLAATSCDGLIAYADKVGIHTINPDGSGRRTIVPSWGARSPEWSPDGSALLYEQRGTDSRQGNVPVRLAKPDGSNARTLFTGYRAQWAPDGRSIVYGVMGNPTRVYRYNLATGRSTELGVSPLPAKARLANFVLSHDGKRLIWYEDNNTPTASVPGSWLVDANLDGTNRRQRHADTYYDGFLDPWPGGRVSYSCSMPGSFTSEICVMNLASGAMTRFSGPNNWMEVHAVRSPSGNSILFGATNGLYVTDSARRNPRTLFTVNSPSANPTDPSWQNLTDQRPTGSVDRIDSLPAAKLRFRGWAYDPNAPTAPLSIHVYVGGPPGTPGATGYNLGKTSVLRPDVRKAHPKAGSRQGFDATISPRQRGTQRVFVYAINHPGTPGGNRLLAASTVVIK